MGTMAHRDLRARLGPGGLCNKAVPQKKKCLSTHHLHVRMGQGIGNQTQAMAAVGGVGVGAGAKRLTGL